MRPPRRSSRVREWSVVVREQQDIVLPWRAEASAWFEVDWSEGVDPASALTSLAGKLGIPTAEMLAAFQDGE